jgi:hypothetical protein
MNFQAFSVVASILLSVVTYASGSNTKTKFLIPKYTRSPDGLHGVTVPIFAITKDDKPEATNKLVEIRTGRVLAIIHADPGYDRL